MENNITSSFIPSDARNLSSNATTGRALYDVALLFAIVVLIASLALAAGVFLYSQYLEADLAAKKEQVERVQKAFDPALMQDITRLDTRMRAGDTILRSHAALSGFFRFLEKATLETAGFKTLQIDASDHKTVSLKMTGVAQSVNSIALQADVFTKGGALSSPLFSNIARREGGVHFDFTAVINPDIISYAQVHVVETIPTDAPANLEQGVPSLTPPSRPQGDPAPSL